MKILNVTKEIKQIQTIIFPGNQPITFTNCHLIAIKFLEFSTKDQYISAVTIVEEPIRLIIEEGVNSFIPNTIGPEKYLKMYEKYFFIQNGEAEKDLDAFMGLDPFPYLKVT